MINFLKTSVIILQSNNVTFFTDVTLDTFYDSNSESKK